MNQLVTTAIVLTRTDFGEADRILTLLTPEHGKLRLMARGVRRVKSKLAGGIELFSVSEITFIKGRGELGTLVSSRLKKYYGTIVQDVDRTMAAYELIKALNKATEDEAGAEYFELLKDAFEALDDAAVPLGVIQFWFMAQLLREAGHTPNLHTDTAGNKLEAGQTYEFSFEDMAFTPMPDRGHFTADHIKLLRIGFGGNSPHVMQKIQGVEKLATDCQPLLRHLRELSR